MRLRETVVLVLLGASASASPTPHWRASAWPYEYAPDDPPLEWPAGWPGLTSPGSGKHASQSVDTIWTIPLAYEHLPELDVERR